MAGKIYIKEELVVTRLKSNERREMNLESLFWCENEGWRVKVKVKKRGFVK